MSKLDWEQSGELNVMIQDDTHTYLNKAIEVIHYGLRGIYYHRTMKRILIKRSIESSAASIYVNNVLLEAAVIGWTKLFGGKNEDTHFSKLISQPYISNDFKECLKKINITNLDELNSLLLSAIKLDSVEFDEYKGNMLKFRDKFIAHTDLGLHRMPDSMEDAQEQYKKRLHDYPSLDTAKESLFWLYELIIDLLECKKENGGKYKYRVHSRNRIEELTNKECKEFEDAFTITSD